MCVYLTVQRGTVSVKIDLLPPRATKKWLHCNMYAHGMGFGNQLISLGNAMCIAKHTKRNLMIGGFGLDYMDTTHKRPFFSLVDRDHFHSLLPSEFSDLEIVNAGNFFNPESVRNSFDVTAHFLYCTQSSIVPWTGLETCANPLLFATCNMFFSLNLFGFGFAAILKRLFAQLRPAIPLQLILPTFPRGFVAVHLRLEDDWISHMVCMTHHWRSPRVRSVLDQKHGFDSLSQLMYASYIWRIHALWQRYPGLNGVYVCSNLMKSIFGQRNCWVRGRLKTDLAALHIAVCGWTDIIADAAQQESIHRYADLPAGTDACREYSALLEFCLASQATAFLTLTSSTFPFQSTFSSFLQHGPCSRHERLNCQDLNFDTVTIHSARYSSLCNPGVSLDVTNAVRKHAVFGDCGYLFEPRNLNVVCGCDIDPGYEKELKVHYSLCKDKVSLPFSFTLRETSPEPFGLLPFRFDHVAA